MALTRITAAGTATIPPEIIDWLHLKPGDPINIAISPDGKVYLEPAPLSWDSLSCSAFKP
jgi:AbrB family looped-hinge helix DNA binding protein